MKLNFLGFWKELSWSLGAKSILEDVPEYHEKIYDTDEKIINYLNSGARIIASRSFITCPFTKKEMKTPTVYTDGRFVWTSAYIHYVSMGVILIDNDFFQYMQECNFVPVCREEIPTEIVDYIKYHAN